MTEEKPYRLIASSLPNPKSRKGVYDRIVEEFVAGDDDVSLIVFDGKSTNTVYQGVYQALRASARTDVAVRRRDGEVYLMKVR